MESKHGTEDAATLQLGPQYETAVCLWNNQLEVILERSKQFHRELGVEVDGFVAEVERYLKTQPRFRTEAAEAALLTVEDFNEECRADFEAGLPLRHEHIERFEAAQIANLGISDADEAITLIPSLAAKFTDPAPLEALLEKLQAYRDE